MMLTDRVVRSVLTLIAVIAGTVCVASAQPKLIIEGGKKFDLGTIYSSQPAKHIVTLRNEGTDTLVVSELSATCGCTGTMLSNDHIAPGGTGSIAISFDPRKFSGKVEKALSFRTNDPNANRNHLSFTANVVKILTVEPDYVMFGRIQKDSTVSQTIVLDNDTDGPIHILSVSVAPEDVTVDMPETTIESGDDVTLTCTFTGTTGGTHKGTISIRTDHPMLPLIEVRYFALVPKENEAASSAH